MKTLNFNNKKAKRYIELYNKSNIYRIDEAYKTGASTAKNIAERNILRQMNDAYGHGYRILSHSHMFFTTGWKTQFEEYLIVDTPSEKYCIPLPF